MTEAILSLYVKIVTLAIFLCPDALFADPRNQTVKFMCGNQIVYNSTLYVPNFVGTMENISTQMRTSGFGLAITGSGLDTNYGLAQCYGDLSLLDCVLCYAEARTVLPQCFPSNGGRIFLDGCFMRVENYSFFQEYTSPNDHAVCGNRSRKDSAFEASARRALSQAVSAAPDRNGYERAVLGTANGLAFVLADCWRTLNANACRACLDNASALVLGCLPWSEGRALNTGCFLRYSDTNFLNPVPRNRSSRGRVIVIVIGTALGGLILLLGVWKSTKFIRRRIKANRRRKFFKRNGGLLLEQQLSATDNGLDKTKLFCSKELARATDHYNENRILGQGGQGTVYKGMLTDGTIVAVKKSKKVEEGDLQVFINEVVILSQLNHRNVVKLLGCCLETDVPLLVYEFIPNGTLFQHIHEPNEEFPLTWEMRVRIAREVAGALAYLHSAASAPIYHRDIKSTNILLDDKYRAKVADFGTSRLISLDQTHLTTRVVGTFGYLDPEYFRSSQFTEKSDVYSFSVVMVELLTGKKAISSIRSEAGRGLAMHFLHAMEENQLLDILDARVVEEGKKEEIAAIAELARRCLHLNGKRRPTMKEVAVELEGLQMVKEGSKFLQNQESRGCHFIEAAESDNLSTIFGSMYFDTITTDADHPFLGQP